MVDMVRKWLRDESRALLSCFLASTWLILPFYSSLAWVNLGVVAKFTWSRDQVYLEWWPRVLLGVQGGDGGGDVRTLIMEEAHATKYSVHPGVNETVARHGVHVSSIPDKDGMCIKTDGLSKRTFRTLENMFRACVRNLVVVGILTFHEAETGESKMIGLELEQETTKSTVGNKSSQDSTASPREKINTAEDLRLLEEDCMKIKTSFGYIFVIQDYCFIHNTSRFGINKWYQSFALRNFDLEDMEFESANSGTTVKLPILKLITKMYVPKTAEEKTNKKNNVKVRSLLLMALPNEHQLTFSQYPDAKSMFSAIKTRFWGFRRLSVGLQSWMNKPEVNTMSIDDLYNNFKIVEQKVKKSVGVSSGAQNLAFMTALSTSNTNDVNTASPQVSTASINVNIASPQQIHEDDLEAMDTVLFIIILDNLRNRSRIRINKWYQSFALRNFDLEDMEFESAHGNNEYTSSKAMLAIDGVGFDWSDMAEEQVQTNMALMAFSNSEVYNDKTCSKTCLKNYETLKKQCDDLIVKLNQTEFTAATYKRGLATVEEQLITYRKNEVLFSEEVAVLKREVACKDYEINVLKSEFEKVKQEKEGIEFKIEKFDKASKDLDKLLESQITDKSKEGLGYGVVPPPHPLIYNRPKKLDLSYSGLDEFKEPEFKGYGSEDSKKESNVVCDKKSDDSKENSDNSLVKEQVSKDTSSFVESSLNVDKETVFPVDKKVESVKPKNHEKPVKKSVRYAEMYRSQTPRGNQRNWNGQKSNQLGSDFVMYNKACFICGSFNHVQAQCKYHQRERMGKPQHDDKGFVDSGCSSTMNLGTIAYLS
ncbi:hypothetical protein Tco_1209759 [Tanacetum coccineum]